MNDVIASSHEDQLRAERSNFGLRLHNSMSSMVRRALALTRIADS